MFGIVAIMALAACTTNGGTTSNGSAPPSQQLSPQQVVAIVCPPMQTALTTLDSIYNTQASLGNASASKAAAGIAKAQPVIAEACAIGATVSTANVQAFVNTALPALAQVAGTLPLSQKQMGDVQTALLTAQVALGVYNVVQSQIAAGASANQSATK
jgi:hypothetical protein